jgi:selenocysteine-specific elongation factor
VTLLAGAPRELERGGRVRLHQGTCEREAAFRVVGRAADDRLLVDLRLGAETVLAPGDRFILRRPSPVDTVGGGVILDACPPRRARVDPALADVAPGDIASAIGVRLARAGIAGVEAPALARELGLDRGATETALDALAGAARAVRAGARWIDGDEWHATAARVVAALDAHHAARPAHAGVAREELRTLVAPAASHDVWRELLEALARAERVRLAGETVARHGHRVTLGPAELALGERLERAFREAALEPPDLENVIGPEDRSRAQPVVAWLVANGALTRIRDGRLFHTAALETLRSRLRERARVSRTIAPSSSSSPA